ncbi:hypothetical protein [Leptolyngbya iicbica]|uniref:Uncharacterized protein n=2 Tax=Cyanophyceae TaxID=3028117 RepID=A0A4V2E3J4_9CYAN|nr:hypothetical protein [Leptolyngbya sp. LK]RZM82650.1 hypothetical protein DYY88_05330 [Leptolyngbya sp. LK]
MLFPSPQTQLIVAQAPAPEPPPAPAKPINLWMMTSGVLFVLLIAAGVMNYLQDKRLRKQIKFVEYKNQELQKRVKMATATITKMEKNPDLVHSREFNLDYLRMRMEEEMFHFQIVNQLKVKVKQQLAAALRPQQAETGMVGIASKARQIDQIFDVAYKTSEALGSKTRILFRIEIKLAKLPTQSTSTTINQIIECIETFLSPEAEGGAWQPTIQGRLANMHWDQKAKPTPLLILEQSAEGVNVTIRSTYKPA